MSSTATKVLLIEDNLGDACLCQEYLADAAPGQFELTHVERLREALEQLTENEIDVILLDLSLPDSQGFETLRKALDRATDIPIVVITGLNDEAAAIKAVEEGAQDYLIKGEIVGSLLVRSIRYAIERNRAEKALQRANDELEERIRERTRDLAAANEALIADVIERRQAEEAIKHLTLNYERQARTLDTILSASPDYVYMYGRDGRCTYANLAGARALGLEPAEVVGKGSKELGLPAEVAVRFDSQLELVFATGQAVRDETRFPTATGAGEYEYILSPVMGGDVEVESVIASLRDITERKLSQRALQKAHDQLERRVDERTRELSESNALLQAEISRRERIEEHMVQAGKMEAIGRIAGGVAHDFNNLLTAIIGYSELLSGGPSDDKSWQEGLEEIKKAAERAAALTQQLLAFGRKQVLQPKVLNLNLVIAEIEKMLRPVVREDIELVNVLDPSLGEVWADPAQIDQVIVNLIVNARDAMPDGGRIRIETANVSFKGNDPDGRISLKPGRYVMFAISDTGCGMDQETQSRVFEPFFTTKEVGKGTGLGLSTVYGIVKQSGGDVCVYSRIGEGTTFKILLPRVDAPAEEVERNSSPAILKSGTETVLLVEDEEVVRKFIRTVLQKSGYTVLEARTGDDALRLCGEYAGPIDLLVSDVVMPGMSGGQLAEKLVPAYSEMRILFISGYSDKGIPCQKGLGKRVDFLQKPFTREMLIRKIEEVLTD
jgi:PAS domain S-box-containing protein